MLLLTRISLFFFSVLIICFLLKELANLFELEGITSGRSPVITPHKVHLKTV